jgi:hypothetical protein
MQRQRSIDYGSRHQMTVERRKHSLMSAGQSEQVGIGYLT